jgi:DNA polymerase-4
LHGSWKEQVRQDEDIKSMGHMYTLPKEFRKREFFLPVLYKLCEMVGRRLRRQNLTGNIIYFFAHDDKWEGFGKSIKLGYLVQDGKEIFLAIAGEAHSLFFSPIHGEMSPVALAKGDREVIKRGVKIIGVTVAGLRPYVNQLSLFGDAEQERRVVAALDEINDKYGEFTVSRALQIPAGKVFRDSIGFGRVKELTKLT